MRTFGVLMVLLAGVAVGSAQGYNANWYTIDGGGTTSTSAVYSVSATIGQPDAGLMSGNLYAVVGGFWATHNPAPDLSITLSNQAVVISWLKVDPRWRLAYSTDIEATWPGAWTIIPPPYATNSTHCVVTEQTPVSKKFYRLLRP